jgi:hypothetical protein
LTTYRQLFDNLFDNFLTTFLAVLDSFFDKTTDYLLLQIFIQLYSAIAVLENVPPDAGLQKRATLSTLNKGLAGTRNQTRATCVANSGTNRSAIRYALLNVL